MPARGTAASRAEGSMREGILMYGCAPLTLAASCCCAFRTRLGEPCLKTYPLECMDLLKRARVAFQAGRTLTENFRLAQLEAVVQMLEEHECDFVDALRRDLHKVSDDLYSLFILAGTVMTPLQRGTGKKERWIDDSWGYSCYYKKILFLIQAANVKSSFYHQPRFESVVSELVLVKNEAMHAINNLRKWMQPQHVERNLVRLCYCYFLHQSPDVCFVPNILTTLSGLFLTCTIYLEWTFRLAATKRSFVPPKKLRSYAAVTFWKSVGFVYLWTHLMFQVMLNFIDLSPRRWMNVWWSASRLGLCSSRETGAVLSKCAWCRS